MKDGLTRSQPCTICGAEMLWMQNAWREKGVVSAAYQCLNGHVVDPSTTRQCPNCGVHNTRVTGNIDGRQQFRCDSCGEAFAHPR